MNFTTVISSEIYSLKKRVVKFLRLGKNDVQTATEAGPSGIDSSPVKDMIAIYSPTVQNGKTVILGYINKNQLADVGEFRAFSTNESGSEVKAFIWLKNDGEIQLGGTADHLVRYSKLEDGFNQLRSDVNALIAEYKLHIHPVPGGSSGMTTSTLNSSTADISLAKINNIKTR